MTWQKFEVAAPEMAEFGQEQVRGTGRGPAEEGVNLATVGLVLPWILLGLTGWVCYRLFLGRGRLLLRIEDLEHQLQELGVASASHETLGLPVGSVLQDFELPDLSGGYMTLSRWAGRRVLLIFFDPRCRFCTAMLPHLAALSPDSIDRRPVPLIISTGDAQENRDLFAAHAIRLPVLLQEDRELASLYRVSGTPMGYLVDEQGVTASALAVGAEAVLALAGMPSAVNGHQEPVGGNGHVAQGVTHSLPKSRLNRNGLKAGTPAPGFRLPRVDGGELSLEDYRARRVLLVFSDPACGPCNQLAPLLEQLQRRSPDLQVLMVSRRDLEDNRAKMAEYGLTFPVVLQRYWEVSRAYGMFATPIGYLIDEQGVIAADVAVGAEAILALASGSPVGSTR
jgi:peroxiredoxin